MLTQPLPRTLDVRTATGRGATISGVLKPHQLQRFRSLLASDEGSIDVELAFSRDEENRYLVRVRVGAAVMVLCQRCLEPMATRLASDNSLAVVWSDDEAARLPGHLDPLIVPVEECDLWIVVEDELILALPAFCYHDTAECRKKLADYTASPDEEPVDDRPNPFDVLAQLKPGKEN
jgi:uncharacterized protein